MAYSKIIYSDAMEIIKKRRNTAEAKKRERHDKAVLIHPEIEELEKTMRESALNAAKAIGMKDKAVDYVKDLAVKNLESQNKIKKILADAKLPGDYLEIKYFCPKCSDTGLVDGKKCDCLKQLLKELSFSKLSDKYPIKDCSFESFDLNFYPDDTDDDLNVNMKKHMTEIYNFCKYYSDDFSKNSESLLLAGETGLGKTHLSLAIAGEAIKKGFGVIYGSAQNLFTALENEKFGKAPSEASAESSMLECDLLILDDVGAEFITQFTVSAFYNIVNSRIMSKKPTIISTNLTPPELESKYSRRITSRIYGNFKYLLFCGKDIRQLKNQ